ncbi:uncharacterized, partial [Tachysurus ichikawai]
TLVGAVEQKPDSYDHSRRNRKATQYRRINGLNSSKSPAKQGHVTGVSFSELTESQTSPCSLHMRTSPSECSITCCLHQVHSLVQDAAFDTRPLSVV